MIRLENTSGSEISRAISHERHRMGAATTGMVLSLLILSDEEFQEDATSAAATSAREHPMRILTLIPRPGRGPDQIDAQIFVGGDDGPGEVAVVRLRGDRAEHANSLVVPLLLPDTPVVAWWPTAPPEHVADDPIGRHAQRRITDAATEEDPLAALAVRRANYEPGDVDLAWTRLTPWRSVLAATLDRDTPRITAARVGVEADNPSGVLLMAWLAGHLGVPVEHDVTAGPGITEVAIVTDEGEIRVSRHDGTVATLSRPGMPDSPVALARRPLGELIAEELRRLTPDEVYADALAGTAAFG